MDMSGHEGHDHSTEHAIGGALAASTVGAMDHAAHSVVGRHADGSYFYTHGAYLGHVVPGTFFIIWGTYWLVATYWSYVRAAAARRAFTSHPWYRLWFGPAWMRRFPMEPAVKVVLPLCGALGEVWLGHESWRTLVGADRKFVVDNINDWQHSAMYAAFATSGVVDLVGAAVGLPAGTERAFLGMAFLCQGLLLVFHLKGPSIEVMVHLILVLQVFSTVVATAAEACAPRSVVAASVRPALTLLQGVWWVQTAHIMYTADPAFDPDDMGGTMMAPVLLVVHMLWVGVFAIGLLLVLRALQSRLLGRSVHFTPLKSSEDRSSPGAHPHAALDDDEAGAGGALELSAFALPKERVASRPHS